MKRIISLFLVAVMCISFGGCGKEKKAFEAGKAAYANIDIAYEITVKISGDIYEAWRLGIYDEDEIIEGGSAYLAKELSLSANEIKAGAAYYVATMLEENWYEMSASEKQQYIDAADAFFEVMKDDMFSYCVEIVVGAYTVNGEIKKAQDALNAAKTQMKEMSQEYSDYEHYPNLKGYYTTTNSYFEFCSNPTGTFEQIKDTIKDYENKARDYISELDYIFEE